MINENNLAFMAKAYEDWSEGGGVAKVGLIFEDDTIHESSNTACHAGLRGLYKITSKRIKLIWSVYKAPHDNFPVEGQVKFIDWMVNRSPYADSFLLKDPDKIVQGCWASDPEKPWDVVVAGSIATRFLSEGYYRNHPLVWKELVDSGADETYAYALSQVYVASSNLYPITPASGDGHTGIRFSSSPINTTRNFVKNLRQTNSNSYQEERTYHNLTSLFKGQHQGMDFMEWAKDVKPVKRSQHLTYNIFDQGKKKCVSHFR